MDLVEAVRRRRTIRTYDPDRPLDPQLRDTILQTALRTPSAGHTQAVRLTCLTGPARERYWQLTAGDGPPDRWVRGMQAAPVLVLVGTSERAYRDRYAEPDKGWAHDSDRWSAPYWWVDAGMVVQTLLLTATAYGVDSAFVGVPRPAQSAVSEAFALPRDEELVGLVTLGHRPAEHRPRPPGRARLPFADRIRHVDR